MNNNNQCKGLLSYTMSKRLICFLDKDEWPQWAHCRLDESLRAFDAFLAMRTEKLVVHGTGSQSPKGFLSMEG